MITAEEIEALFPEPADHENLANTLSGVGIRRGDELAETVVLTNKPGLLSVKK